MTTVKTMLCILLGSFLASGCAEDRPPSSSSPDAPNVAPQLSMTQVLQMADEFAKQKRAVHETFDLKFYPERKATFDIEDAVWWVHYDRKPNRYPGDHFGIRISDATGETDYIGGR